MCICSRTDTNIRVSKNDSIVCSLILRRQPWEESGQWFRLVESVVVRGVSLNWLTLSIASIEWLSWSQCLLDLSPVKCSYRYSNKSMSWPYRASNVAMLRDVCQAGTAIAPADWYFIRPYSSMKYYVIDFGLHRFRDTSPDEGIQAWLKRSTKRKAER